MSQIGNALKNTADAAHYGVSWVYTKWLPDINIMEREKERRLGIHQYMEFPGTIRRLEQSYCIQLRCKQRFMVSGLQSVCGQMATDWPRY